MSLSFVFFLSSFLWNVWRAWKKKPPLKMYKYCIVRKTNRRSRNSRSREINHHVECYAISYSSWNKIYLIAVIARKVMKRQFLTQFFQDFFLFLYFLHPEKPDLIFEPFQDHTANYWKIFWQNLHAQTTRTRKFKFFRTRARILDWFLEYFKFLAFLGGCPEVTQF